MRFSVIILFIAGGLFGTAQAGKYAAEFLDTGIGVRAMGMGGAFTAIADDASSVYWNPAGLMRLSRPEAAFMHASNFAGLLQSDVLHAAKPTASYALGLTYLRVGVSDIKYTSRLDPNGRPIIDKTVNDVEQALLVSAAKPLAGDKLLAGVTVKALQQSIGDNRAFGFGFDAGVLYRLGSGWSLGAILQDISGTFVFWDTGHRDVKAPRLSLGAAYGRELPRLRSSVLLAVQQISRFEGNSLGSGWQLGDWANGDLYAGAEWTLYRLLALRFGSAAGDWTAGAGLTIKRLRFDYAFMTHELGNAHRVAVTVGW